MVGQIFKDHKVTDEAQAAITLVQMSQANQQRSSSSQDRKGRILDFLFQNRRETLVKLNLLRGLLTVFQGYVKAFQSDSPMIHALHSRMVEVTSELLGMFIKPEHIPERVSKLIKVDPSDESLQKADRDLTVGKYAFVDLNKARLDKTCTHWVTKLYKDLRAGYAMAAKKMLLLPLTNSTLRYLSVLDPDLVGHSQVEACLKKLGGIMPSMLTDEEQGRLSVEASRYNTDQQVKDLVNNFADNERVDIGYWSKVFSLKDFQEERYPMLRKMVSSMLTIFSGPLVEATFNIMDDIIEKDRTKLTVINYEAIAIVKTTLRKKGVKSSQLQVTAEMKKACIYAYDTYQRYLRKRKETEEAKAKEKLSASVLSLKKEKAKKLAKLVKLKNRLVSKRKADASAVGPNTSWKRIKCSED